MYGGSRFIFVFAICFMILIAIRLLARMDNIIGHICKWYWNIGFKIAAHIPFFGWMAHFIISDGSEMAEKEKEHYVNVGQKADEIADDYIKSQIVTSKIGEMYRYNGDYYEVISTYNHTALLRNCTTGETINVVLHGSEGYLADTAGNLYLPNK